MDRAEGDTFHGKAALPKPWATNEELVSHILTLALSKGSAPRAKRLRQIGT